MPSLICTAQAARQGSDHPITSSAETRSAIVLQRTLASPEQAQKELPSRGTACQTGSPNPKAGALPCLSHVHKIVLITPVWANFPHGRYQNRVRSCLLLKGTPTQEAVLRLRSEDSEAKCACVCQLSNDGSQAQTGFFLTQNWTCLASRACDAVCHPRCDRGHRFIPESHAWRRESSRK